MRIINQTTIFEGKTPESAIACFPGLCRLGANEILASFQVAPEKNHATATVALARSTDKGKNWSEPQTPFKDWAESLGQTIHVAYLSQPLPNRLMALLMVCDHLGEPDLPFFHPETGGALPIRIGYSESLDGGATWAEPSFILTGQFDHLPVPIMSPIIAADQDTLIFGCETSKAYEDREPWDHHAVCLRSRDGGASWEDVVTVAHDPTGRFLYWDHRLASYADGRCMDFFYVFDNHAGQATTAHFAVSHDAGKTWSAPPTDARLQGQPWPVALQGEELVLVLVDRDHSRSIKAYYSNDWAKSWIDELVVFQQACEQTNTHSLVDNLQAQQNWNYGLPSGISTGADEFMMIWYEPSSRGTKIDCATIQLDDRGGTR